MQASLHFQLFDYAAKMQAFDPLKIWESDFRLPSFDASKAERSLEDTFVQASLYARLRDANSLQSSSAMLAQGKLEADLRVKLVENLKVEVDRCLMQSVRVVSIYSFYTRTIGITLTETGRIFIAGEFMLYQFEVETRAKDELWNLRVTEYGCVVMSSILHSGKWWAPVPVKNKTGKILGVIGYAAQGAQIGAMVGGGYGAAVGAVVGIIVGIALEFF